MAFILLHKENGFCGHEPAIVNTDQIAAVETIALANKFYVKASQSCVRLADGTTMNVREPFDHVMGTLREASGGQKLPGTGPQLLSSQNN